jgi:hypothetical protein
MKTRILIRCAELALTRPHGREINAYLVRVIWNGDRVLAAEREGDDPTAYRTSMESNNRLARVALAEMRQS